MRKLSTVIFIVTLTIVASAQKPLPSDLILHNGVIYTVDSKDSNAQAVAIKDGKFVIVGSNKAALRLKGPKTRVIDLRGNFVTPGFNDNHVHFSSAAQFLEFNIMNVSTQEQFVARVKDVVSRLARAEWIVGGFWGAYDQWAAGSSGGQKREPFAPDMSLVEGITADYPMFIRKFDDTQFAANRAALRALKLDSDNPTAADVEFLRDKQGRINGHMRGPGVTRLFASVVPRTFSRERRLQQTRNALAEIRRFGVTNISDMSDDTQLDIYRELHQKGELTVRVHFRPGLDLWKELAERGVKVGAGDEWIRLGALKGHIDGIMGTSSARFFQPYSHDPNNRGRWRPLMVNDKGEFVEGKFLGYMLDADRAGLQLTVHAIGDEANSVLLNYLEELDHRNGKRDRRFRLVHAQVLAPDDFKRLGQLGVVAEVQPFHLSDDMRWMEERIGNERSRGAYAFKSIQASGAILSFGTDWPGTSASEYPINPMLGLYAAVTRQTLPACDEPRSSSPRSSAAGSSAAGSSSPGSSSARGKASERALSPTAMMLLVSGETVKPFTGRAGVPARNERAARTRKANGKFASNQACEGKPKGGWFPAERISIEDAIRAYTYNTAYANFEEKIKGSIEVGKLADLTVLSKNLLRISPREMLTTEVLYTIVDGKIVYEKVR